MFGRRKPTDPEPGETGSESPATFSAPAEGPNPLGLEGGPRFEPERERPDVAHAADLEAGEDYVPPAAEPIEWTADRVSVPLRAMASLVHHADPLGRDPGGEDLWRLTEQDAAELGEPLARILNRYSLTRTAAGFSDELAVGLALMGYGRRNLVLRGQLMQAHHAREGAPPPGLFEGADLVEDHTSTAEVPLQGVHGAVFPPPPEEPLE